MFNVFRTYPMPQCLSRNTYLEEDVVFALERIFQKKCYLCERKNLSDPEVEHFIPHEKNPELKYRWSNLYYACSRCNSIKSVTKNLLDCCDTQANMTRIIKHLMPGSYDGDFVISNAAGYQYSKIDNTVSLLHRCYNEDNTAIRGITRANQKKEIFRHYTKYLNQCLMIFDDESTTQQVNDSIQVIRRMLDVDYPYSIFWRWQYLEDSKLQSVISAGDLNF